MQLNLQRDVEAWLSQGNEITVLPGPPEKRTFPPHRPPPPKPVSATCKPTKRQTAQREARLRRILAVVREHTPLGKRDLYAHIGAARVTVSADVSVLAEAGLLAGFPHPTDQRRGYIYQLSNPNLDITNCFLPGKPHRR